MRIIDVAETIGLLLAVGGLMFAIFQARDARTQLQQLRNVTSSISGVSRDLDGVKDNLDKVAETILTKSVDQFPYFMENIGDVIQGAQKDLTIFCDLPAYGVFSNRAQFDRYTKIIRTKLIEGVPVKLICLERVSKPRGRELTSRRRSAVGLSGREVARSVPATEARPRGFETRS